MTNKESSQWRFYFVLGGLLLGALSLLWRMIDLNLLQRSFLMQQSNARILRTVSLPAYRGMITDRFYQPLAISAQVDSVWVNPQLFEPNADQVSQLSRLLKIPTTKIYSRGAKKSGKEFLYLKRGIPPIVSQEIHALSISGLFSA